MLFNFSQITLPQSPNYCIVAPGGDNNKRWLTPKTYKLSKTLLMTHWEKMIGQQDRVTLIRREDDQIKYSQRSKLFNFIDIIVVQFNELNDNHSSLSIYSSSVKGYWDFGVNCKRIRRWLQPL